MSTDHSTWAWNHSKAEGGALLVLLALADSVNYLNDEDECWPKQGKLATRVRLSERQVVRCVQELEDLGEISKRRTQRGNVYKILMPRAEVTDCPNDVGVTSEVPSASDSKVTPTSDPYVESEVEPERKQNGALFEAPSIHEELHDLYRQAVPGQTRSRLTPKTQKMIDRALKERDADALKRAIRGLAASDHHMQNGFTALKYAIGQVNAERGVGGQIDMMAAKAPKTRADGRLTIEELMRGFSPPKKERTYSYMVDVRRSLTTPSAHNAKLAADAEAELERFGIIVIERGDRNVVWGKA
jgi:hypothetical protein